MTNDVRAHEAAWAAVLLAAFGAAICATYASAALLGAGRLHSASNLAITIAVRETSTLVVLTIVMRRYIGLTLRDLGVLRPSAGDVALGISVGLALLVISGVIGQLVGAGRPSPIYGALLRGDGVSQIAAIFMVGVWSPFVQEVVFRGALLRALHELLPAAVSVAISALVFGVVHAASGLGTVVSSFVDGLALGALTLRRGTLTAAVASHITINLGLSSYVVLWSFVHRAH